MTQPLESGFLGREEWETQCVAALLMRRRNTDVVEAETLVHAAWSIERFRTMPPGLAAEELLRNRGVQPATR